MLSSGSRTYIHSMLTKNPLYTSLKDSLFLAGQWVPQLVRDTTFLRSLFNRRKSQDYLKKLGLATDSEQETKFYDYLYFFCLHYLAQLQSDTNTTLNSDSKEKIA